MTGSDGGDDDLGDSDRKAHDRARAEHRALGAADRGHAIQSSLTVEVLGEPPQTGEHAVHRLATAPGISERVDVGSGQPRDLRACHVRHDVERLTQDSRVGHDRRDAKSLDTIAQVRDLGAFRVQGTD